ncbi:hypothetical protein ASF28_18670 [Methylobacterium sp. Leaf99]|uniref:curli-like amyloid fiber formation chaperone CsgH n=1 Tax=Methylobacterium sp. Leaf99 TaxID=1736251 RepID=UPI0006F93448|nr:curli-like amyloid fiber formation chaperone CsgH [Methylobacterium sp. Leaf99]KQP04856.1 hypothetical protein ASF28_18670 [Methylobacterium sp. Leaf99]
MSRLAMGRLAMGRVGGLACLVLPLLATGAISMEPDPEVSTEAVLRCRIERETAGPMTTLRGIALARADAAGTYSLLVIKTGPGGTSRLQQGGRFQAVAGARTGLGEIRLSLEPQAGFEATLTLEVDGRRIGCKASVAPSTPL